MKNLSKAIELARKNGWEKHLQKFVINTTVISNPDLLDPLFWQALGKALGWDKGMGKYGKLPTFIWQAEWHNFIDHLIAGKDAESFFKNLLTP